MLGLLEGFAISQTLKVNWPAAFNNRVGGSDQKVESKKVNTWLLGHRPADLGRDCHCTLGRRVSSHILPNSSMLPVLSFKKCDQWS